MKSAKTKSGKVLARVMVDMVFEGRPVKPNDLIEGDAEVIATLHRQGGADPDPAGVRYAQSLRGGDAA